MPELDFQIKKEDINGYLLVLLAGHFDGQVLYNDHLREELEIDADKVIIDLSNVSYMSSHPFGYLIELKHKIEEKNGRIKFCGFHERIKRPFEKMELLDAFDIYNSVDDALAD